MVRAKLVTKCNHLDRKHFAKGLCHSCYNLAWNNRTPESREKWLQSMRNNYKPVDYMKKHGEHLYRRYRITYEDFLRIKEEQNNCCSICLKEFTKTPHVDHDHETGITRQLVCSGCNQKIGLMEYDENVMRNVVEYLAKHNSNSIKNLVKIVTELQLHLEKKTIA